MVTYTQWTSIVFDVAPDDAEPTEVISWAAARWQANKEGLRNSTMAEARRWASSQL